MDETGYRFYEQSWPEGEHRHFQAGYVVDDLIGTAGRWARVLGIGPFHVLPRAETACTYRGRPSTQTSQIAVAQAGPLQIELIEPHSDGPNVYRDLAGNGSCRFHQLSTVTEHYEKTRAHFVDLGYEIVCELDARGQHVAYVDTLADFGFYSEIVENAPGFMESLAKISRTCAQWDGETDPVRILTREGYRTP